MLACVLLAGNRSTASSPFVTSNATVVLFCGLAGDADSENRYQAQLQAWLELWAGSAKKCLIYSDEPALIKPPPGITVQKTTAARDRFLSLPDSIGPQATKVRVIMWGHGGNQGNSPVLHVRGPRITPSDLLEVGEHLDAQDIEWVLLFRGSGGFAQALGARGELVMASEAGTMFESDPVSMELLLKLLRASRGLGLDELGQKLGESTRGWYRQRNLAQTEEPTLWVSGDMHPLDARGAAAPEIETESASQVVSIPTAPPDRSSPSDREPRDVEPSGWDRIARVNAKDFPDADAVVLSTRTSCVWANAPVLQTEREEYIQVLKPEGKRFGDFDVSYAPPEEELEFLSCEVLGPDGKLVRADPEKIGIAAEHAPSEYQPRRRKLFSLPGVVPGAVLHVRYRSEWRTYPLPRLSWEIAVGGELPVQKATVAVSSPCASPFHYYFEGVTAPEPTVERGQYSARYLWQLTNLPAEVRETLAAPHRGPRLLVSTFTDWPEFGQWYSRLVRMTAELSPALRQKASELTRTRNNPREKVEAVYNYVTGLRYVAIPLGVSSVRPHTAQSVLENQFGDCKDKANLLNALLGAVGIDARLALVPRFGQAHPEVPGFSFNHAISVVKLADQTLWLDSTDEQCRCGWLPPGDPGRNVFVIGDSNFGSLTELPLARPEANRIRIEGKLALAEQGTDWTLELSASSAGYPDYSLRRALHRARNQFPPSALLGELFQPVVGSFALEEQSSTDVSDLARDFVWKGRGSCVALGADLDGKLVLHAPFWLPREWDLALNRRRTSLFLNEGYPLRIEEEFYVTAPLDLAVESVPPARENHESPLNWRVEWTKSNDQALIARLTAELVTGELSPTQSAGFQTQFRQLRAALGADALFIRRNHSSNVFKTTQN